MKQTTLIYFCPKSGKQRNLYVKITPPSSKRHCIPQDGVINRTFSKTTSIIYSYNLKNFSLCKFFYLYLKSVDTKHIYTVEYTQLYATYKQLHRVLPIRFLYFILLCGLNKHETGALSAYGQITCDSSSSVYTISYHGYFFYTADTILTFVVLKTQHNLH